MTKTISLNFNTCILKELPLRFVDGHFQCKAGWQLQLTENELYIARYYWYCWNEQNTQLHDNSPKNAPEFTVNSNHFNDDRALDAGQ
jgi:hypothetical protein